MEAKDKIELPKGFEEMVRGVIGEGEWDAFVEALSEEPSVSVRVNGQRSTVNGQQSIDGIQFSTVKWCEHGRYLAERPKFTYDPMLFLFIAE